MSLAESNETPNTYGVSLGSLAAEPLTVEEIDNG